MIFSKGSIENILNGSKTMTRRLVKKGEMICLELPIPKKVPKPKIKINWEDFNIKQVD